MLLEESYKERSSAMCAKRTEEQISEIMRCVKSHGTGPELAFRKALWSHGVRYHLGSAGLPGKPDLVFRTRRLVVFIDGDYWHGNQWYNRGHASLRRQMEGVHGRDYWIAKILRNVKRDRNITQAIIDDGWTVLRFWESDLRKRLDNCLELTMDALAGRTDDCWTSCLSSMTFAEFFAGIGLVRLALASCGWTGVFANDIDPMKREIYIRNFPHDPPGHLNPEDIHLLPASKAPTVTFAAASFPCNDLSVAGARNGLAGNQSSAFWGFIRVLREMGSRRPALVMLENVVGFLTSHRGEDFRSALLALNELGYVCDSFILDAANFVPQSRQRLFVIGLAAKPEYGSPPARLDVFSSSLRPPQLANFITNHPEIEWYLRPLPDPPSRSGNLANIIQNPSEDDPMWWNQGRCDYLLSQMSPRHEEQARKMIAGDEIQYGTIFRRVRNGRSMAELRTDGIAGCLRTPRGGSGRQILFVAGQGQYRCRLLTPRECARLQGVPDSYNVDFPLNQALFGFGDAVCVDVIKWIAENYLNPVVSQLMRGRIMSPLMRCAGGAGGR